MLDLLDGAGDGSGAPGARSALHPGGEVLSTRWKKLIAIGLTVLVLDQVTKFWAVDRLTRAFEMEDAETFSQEVSVFLSAENLERIRERPVVVSRDYWRFRYVENPGAAWGIFGKLGDGVRVPFFFVISAAAIAFILWFFSRLRDEQRLLQVALSMVLGGALGNFVDRLVHGYVIDFIDFHWRNDPRLHWPTFNVADIGISVGVAILLFETLTGRHERAAEAPPAAAQGPIDLPDEPMEPLTLTPLAEDPAEGSPGNRADAKSGSDREA